MPAVKSLADGHVKFTICTTKPANPEKPTVTELAAGIDASCRIMSSDFSWEAIDSEKIAEKELCVENNANAFGAGNYQGSITPFRYFDVTTKAPDAVADTVFAALKVKGTVVWCYARLTAKKSTEPWAADDEIYLGGEALSDNPQKPTDLGGYIKYKVPLEIQQAYPFIKVAAGV